MTQPSHTPAPSRQPQAVDVGVLEAELRAAMLAPAERNRYGLPRTDRDLEKNVRRGVNKAPATLARLVYKRPDRAMKLRELLGRVFMPRIRVRDMGALFREETRAEGQLNVLQSEEVTGVADRRVHTGIIAHAEEMQRIYDVMIAHERSELTLPVCGVRT